MKFNSKKIIVVIILGMGLALLPNVKFDFDRGQKPNVENPKPSAIYDYIIIDALATTNTTSSGNWTWARAQPWCTTGDGTKESPYIIENVTIIFPPALDCLTIRNSRKHFTVRNCTLKDTSFAGIRLENVTNANIMENQVYNNSIGINCLDVNNSQFIDNNCSINTGYGIHFDSCFYNTISENTVNLNNYGIYLDSGDYNNITGNTANDNDNGIFFDWFCDNNTISGNTVNDNTNDGIYLVYKCNNNTISGNTASDNGHWGIWLNDNCDSNYITGNTASDNGNGIVLEYCDNNTLSGNTATYNNDGIYLEESNDNVISGNTVNENIQNGIYSYFCDYNKITGNTANDNGDNGIFLDDDSNNNTISGNTANDNAIRLESSDYNNITGNIVNNHTGDPGIYLFYSDNNTLSGNTATYNNDGIYLEESNDNVISGNTVNNNTQHGIFLEHCNYNLIALNEIIDNLDTGIRLYGDEGASANNNITDNKIYRSLVGLYFDDNCRNNKIIKNVLYKNSLGVNIDHQYGENNLFHENFFLKNGKHATDDGTDNYWNSTIIGNYWDNHTGPDSGSDGIVDIQYNISGSAESIDYLPIAEDGAPSITINSPVPGNIFGSSTPSFNVKITDEHLDEMWYTIDGGLNNYTFTVNGSIDQSAWDAAPESSVTLTFYASDIPRNITSAEVIITKDFVAPVININIPTAGEYFGSSAPSFTITITEDYLDTMWYTLDGGLNNYTFTSNDTLDQSAWNTMVDGIIPLQFYANDTLGHTGSAGVNIIKDTVAPIITINSPNPGEVFGNGAPSFNVTVTDLNLESLWYSLDGGLTNITCSTNGTIDPTAWLAVPDGLVTITFNANDTLGHVGTAGVNIEKESEAPTIDITSPTASHLFGTTAPLFNVRISDDNLDSMWYTLDGGLNNYAFTDNGTIDQSAWNALVDGTITLQFHANDTLGHIGTAGVNIEKDTQTPIITINSPSPGEIFGNNAPTFDVTVTDPNLDSVWLVFEGVTLNLNIPIVGTINDTVWSALPEGSYTITFHANDTLGHATSEAITITKDVPSKAGIGLDYFMTSFLIFIMGGMAIIAIITRIHQKKRITPA